MTERGCKAQLCRTFDVALPRELTRQEQLGLGRSFAQSFVDDGMVVDWALHDEGDGNPHLHLMMPMRACDGSGFLPKCRTCYVVRNASGEEREATASELKALGDGWEKVFRYRDGRTLTKTEAEAAGLHPTKDRKSSTPLKRKLRTTDWDDSAQVPRWRKRWEDMANDALANAGSKERIDCRSNAERGIELLPMLHLGPYAAAAERAAQDRARERGEEYEPVTDIGRENLRRQRINEWLKKVIQLINELMRTRAERARTLRSKREAQRAAARRRPRRKAPYAPQRGRRTSRHGGLA